MRWKENEIRKGGVFMPKISVIMPAYNAEKYIKEAVDSILCQTFEDFELIVINDCSKDSTKDILLSYTDPRIVYLENQKNLGVAGTLNHGLSAARGDYIARMDSDDIAIPQRLERQLAYMEANPDVVICGGNVILFTDAGQERQGNYPAEDKQIKTALLFSSPFAHPVVMMRGSVLREHGLCYEVAFEKVEDYRLWTQLAKVGRFANLQEPLLRYRKHPGQVCATSPQVQYEGKLRLAATLLPKVGIDDAQEQHIIVDAFDGRIVERNTFGQFENLVFKMIKHIPTDLDERQLRLILKSKLIEIALSQKMRLHMRNVGLLGIKAWLYVNLGGK